MRVFVSSVMNGFEAERAAARRAIELLRLEPVMAENFGAKPQSSQSACVDQVRGSNVYLAILGERYGFVTRAGKSVTEEEFEAARERGLQILVFVSREDKESEQEAFIRRISDYDQGYFYANYSDAHDLQDAIVQALNDLLRGRGEGVSPQQAGRTIEERLNTFNERREGSPSLVVGIMPGEDYGEVISPQRLGDAAFQDELRQLLLFGKQPRLFDSGLGTEMQEGVQHVEFRQLGTYREEPKTSAVVFADASLATMVDLENGRRGGFSIVEGWVIDRALVEERLRASLQFASSFYRLLDDRRLTEYFVWAALRNVGQRQFGELPNRTVNSMSMPMHGLGPTIWATNEPRKLSRQELEDGGGVASDFVERFARIFKASDAYYTPTKNHW